MIRFAFSYQVIILWMALIKAFETQASFVVPLIQANSKQQRPSAGAAFRRSSMTAIGVSSSSSSSSAADASPPHQSSSAFNVAQFLLDMALQSPLWKYVLVPQARKKIVETAKSNGIDWDKAKQWLAENIADDTPFLSDYEFPSYYTQPFHAYERGNLCWEAALEQEIASCAVGARNFPHHGINGEDAFRSAFEGVLRNELNVTIPAKDAIILDMGCGTGVSTRRLALNYRQAKRVIGLDLSPYFIQVGRKLLNLQPNSMLHDDSGTWVHDIVPDERIQLLQGDACHTRFDNDSIDMVNIQFVVHELPHDIARQVIDEAHRVLKPGGSLVVTEMDFEAPAYQEQRSNPLLFSLIRATEPYLDEYAESQSLLRKYIASKFENTTVTAATGRHYALVAIKQGVDVGGGILHDLRFRPDGTYLVEDTHLKVWENKQ